MSAVRRPESLQTGPELKHVYVVGFFCAFFFFQGIGYLEVAAVGNSEADCIATGEEVGGMKEVWVDVRQNFQKSDPR